MDKLDSYSTELTAYKEVLLWASSFLEKNGAESFSAEWFLKEMMDWSKTDLLNHLQETMPTEIKVVYLENIHQHAKGIPAQQLIGHAWFYDRRFRVSKDTLIPRPETEELVERVLVSLPSAPQKILDIGTGTGAIACTLKAERMQDDVTGIDISAAALAIAKENGIALQTPVRFLEGDLIAPVKHEVFDVIVSNPPYIGEEEIGTLEESVRQHEPALALFGGKDGLDIYRRLAKELPLIMHSHSRVFLEIGFQQGQAVKQLMEEAFPNRTVQVIQDMSGKERMIQVGPL